MKRMWGRRRRGRKKRAGTIQRGGRSLCLCPYEEKVGEILQSQHHLHLLRVREKGGREKRQEAISDLSDYKCEAVQF